MPMIPLSTVPAICEFNDDVTTSRFPTELARTGSSPSVTSDRVALAAAKSVAPALWVGDEKVNVEGCDCVVRSSSYQSQFPVCRPGSNQTRRVCGK